MELVHLSPVDSSPQHASLRVTDLSLSLKVGCTAAERSQAQEILFTVDLRFGEVPDACFSDDLDETICYGALASALRERLQIREFHLLEHLAHEAYQTVRSLSRGAAVAVTVAKVKAPVPGLRGPAVFRLGDFAP